MEYLGIVALCLVLSLSSRVSQLERTLRENGIQVRAKRMEGGQSLSDVLASRKGSVVTLKRAEELDLEGEIADMDEEWVLVLVRESPKKPPKEILVRLNDITSVKDKKR